MRMAKMNFNIKIFGEEQNVKQWFWISSRALGLGAEFLKKILLGAGLRPALWQLRCPDQAPTKNPNHK